MKNNQCALELNNIVKIYGQGSNSVTALKNVSLSFRKSEFVSILGPSGCGKTTLLNIVGGLDRYTSGDLLINGKSTKEFKDSDWDAYRNDSIGFVFQNYNLIPHQTVLANVELALTLSGASKTERRKKAKKALKEVGLGGLEHKRPNQLSGGQMQRVAIARALVNDPDIILADEPTGALDSETSIQVMEILKAVSKDRLVIMVTHNPALAEEYSTRIINLLDGEKTGDTNPYAPSVEVEKTPKRKIKSQMKFFTALTLSLSNLRTKKGRTILTSIAGSIGIIGIALVLALSTGFSAYINKLQADTLSVYPVTVSEATIDLTDFEELVDSTITDEMLAQKLTEKVYSKDMFWSLSSMLKSNRITSEYISYVKDYVDTKNAVAEEKGEDWAYSLQLGYGFDMNNHIYSNIGLNSGAGTDYNVMAVNTLVKMFQDSFADDLQNSNMNISVEFVREYVPTMSEVPDNQHLVESQYDLIHGDWATDVTDLMLVVDEYNQLDDITLSFLGYRSIEEFDREAVKVIFGGDGTLSFEEVIGKKFYCITNDARYQKLDDGNYIEYCFSEDGLSEKAGVTTLNVKGIVRLKEGIKQGVLKEGIAYTSALTKKVLEDNINSQINEYLKTVGDGSNVNVYSCLMTEQKIKTMLAQAMGISPELITNAQVKELMKLIPAVMNRRTLAGDDTINKISVYSSGYETKEALKTHLDAWNEKPNIEELDKVHYSDSTEMLFSALNSMVDAVKIVLIFFTSISLIVSSIMIGIITYVSVVERTKEIGVLRSLGARKKDISRIFNAETFIIGLFAGLIGVITAYLITIPINLIVNSLMAGIGNIAMLKITDSMVLVVISFALTLIAGIFPSRIAAKKDPVVALRTE